MSEGAPHWRVFPWDPEAEDGAPFSASFVPVQGAGRFDVPGVPVCYLGEFPEHAVGERLLRFRGRTLNEADLLHAGRALALARVVVAGRAVDALADCCDPAVLFRLRLRPDTLASLHLARTQAVAAAVREAGHAGLRWWSSRSEERRVGKECRL